MLKNKKFKCWICNKNFALSELGSTNVFKKKNILRCKSCTDLINSYLVVAASVKEVDDKMLAIAQADRKEVEEYIKGGKA